MGEISRQAPGRPSVKEAPFAEFLTTLRLEEEQMCGKSMHRAHHHSGAPIAWEAGVVTFGGLYDNACLLLLDRP